MRALYAIAFILSFGGFSRALISGAQASDAEETYAPADAASPEDQDVVEHIERVDIDTSDDDRPPSLRREEHPAALDEPAPQESSSPWRGYWGVSTGLTLRLNPRDEFQQRAVAPAYLHLRGGVVLPGHGALRHGLQLGVTTNLSREGVYPGGVLALRQWALVPSYVLRIGVDSTPLPAWIATARVGMPVVLSPDATLGAELAIGAQYFARAGFAVFAEVIYDVFVGGRVRDGSRSTHHLLTLEVGLQFELEALP